ncbi:MAG: hypothetical protein JSV91_13455 [Phycisphaerales bacterium]|nr:MAG: hypothetical protein JSV91_13455 [Phycisphaerales bacterium]
MRSTKRVCGYLLGVVMVLSMAGCFSCKSKMKRFNIQVSLAQDPYLADREVTVDLVGVSRSDKEKWETKSINAYWIEEDGFRGSYDSILYKIDFPPGTEDRERFIGSKDDIWNTWEENGAWHLFVLAYIANTDDEDVHVDLPGAADPWRAILPLDQCWWDSGTNTIKIIVRPKVVSVLTSPLSEKR